MLSLPAVRRDIACRWSSSSPPQMEARAMIFAIVDFTQTGSHPSIVSAVIPDAYLLKAKLSVKRI